MSRSAEQKPLARSRRDQQSRGRWHRRACDRDISPATSEAMTTIIHPCQRPAKPISKAKIQLAQPYIKNEQQSEGPSGRHSRVDQSGISTTISQGKVYLAQPFNNSNQQSESTSGAAGLMMGAYPHSGENDQQRENTTGTDVYQQRAVKRRPFWTAHSCRPELYINRDQQSERMSVTAVYQQRSAK